MKAISRILTVLLLAVMVFSLLPNMEAPVEAAGNPILVINPTTAVNPILDHKLDFNTFSSGGPFTVTFDWKCDLQLNDPTKGEYFASVIVEGTVYGSTTQTQVYPGYRINGKTGWQTKSFQFQNVGVYNVSGSNLPGGLLRFYVLYAKGEFQIRNLTIKNAAGTVLYNLNTDPVVAQAMTNMRNQGLTEIDMGELAAIDYENCPWVAGQFASGAYSSFLREDSTAAQTTTSSITRPTTKKPTTTQPTTQKPTTQKPTTQKPTTTPPTPTNPPVVNTTTQPTTVKPTTTRPTTKKPTTQQPPAGHNCNTQGHSYVQGYCKYCGASDPNYDPCALGHSFENGYCRICLTPDPTFNPCANGHNYRNGSCITCGASDPNWVAPDVNVTTQPTTQPVIQPTTGTPGADGESEETFSVLTIVLLAILAGGVVMLNVLLVGNMMGKRKK